MGTVRKIHQHVQWTTVSTITALASLPGKCDIYIGDYWGLPKALHAVVDTVRDIRHIRYRTRRDNTDGTKFYLEDNTIGFRARILNGNSKSAGHHAH